MLPLVVLVKSVEIAPSPRNSKLSVSRSIVASLPRLSPPVPAFKLNALALAAQLVVPSVLAVST